jgi:pilus assembly protein CpaB
MNPRQRRGLLLLVLAGLGLLAVFVLIASYVADVREEVDPKIELLTLSKPVRAYESVPDDAVTTVKMPERWAPPTALRDRAELVGLVAGSDLGKESLLQKGMLVSPPELAPGQREVAILVDAETGVAGKIGPGAVVDIVATFEGDPQRDIAPKSTVVVPGARIIAVGQTQLKGGRGVREAEADPTEVVPVTFALRPRDQLKVTEAESFAEEVRLALLRPGEPSELKPGERTYTRPELR